MLTRVDWRWRSLLGCLLIGCLLQPVGAVEVLLRDGRLITGAVEVRPDGSVVVTIPGRPAARADLDQVRRITFNTTRDLQPAAPGESAVVIELETDVPAPPGLARPSVQGRGGPLSNSNRTLEIGQGAFVMRQDFDGGFWDRPLDFRLRDSVADAILELRSVTVWFSGTDPARPSFAADLTITTGNLPWRDFEGSRVVAEVRPGSGDLARVSHTFAPGTVLDFDRLRVQPRAIGGAHGRPRRLEVVYRVIPRQATVAAYLTLTSGTRLPLTELPDLAARQWAVPLPGGSTLALPVSRFAHLAFAQLTPAQIAQLNHPGALLVGGDFIDGEPLTIDRDRLTLLSDALGVLELEVGRRVVAVSTANTIRPTHDWEIATRDGTVIRTNKPRFDGRNVEVEDVLLGKLTLRLSDLTELRFMGP